MYCCVMYHVNIGIIDRPDNVHDSIVSFLIERQQRCVIYGALCSAVLCITRGIIHGLRVGPTFDIVMKSTIPPINTLILSN